MRTRHPQHPFPCDVQRPGFGVCTATTLLLLALACLPEPAAAATATAKRDVENLRLAISDLIQSHGDRYPHGQRYLRALDRIEDDLGGARPGAGPSQALARLRRRALLENPLLDFDELLVLRRDAAAPNLGLPQNWQGNCALPRGRYRNQIVTVSLREDQAPPQTVFAPDTDRFLGDLDLHPDGSRLLFSMRDAQARFQIWEVGVDGNGLRHATLSEDPAVDNYDACYLPDGRIIFGSTRCFHGVPCVGGNSNVANLFLMSADGSGIRQLCFDQDHNWCPTVLNNGRVLYTRWEYSDTPHYFSRLLFHMNPDGTGQAAYYGSNSYWPNSLFYARPVPGHPTMVAAIVSGHHGVARMGELVLLDPARGRYEAQGAVQRIPGRGRPVEPIVVDQLVNNSWPRFLHPFPLSEKYLLASCRPSPKATWGIYLVDVFDNLLLIRDEPGQALLEPIPLRRRSPAPVIPDRVRTDTDEAVVYLHDVYRGPGLAGLPRGTVKRLRIYEFHYAYPKMGGHLHVGIDGPWDVRRIHGTVPVDADGSAVFRVPANTPLAVQPLDADGRALQVMRSWFTAMPGEVLSCVGCHEQQNTTPPPRPAVAAGRVPDAIEPWYGPPRGFSFSREVQPVLNRYCVGCHDGMHADGPPRPDFRADQPRRARGFTGAYTALHPYVRRPGPESDYHLQPPMEWHADTSELVQMLRKGHHDVQLDEEAWDRVVTWIDLNVPDHGTWGEHRPIPNQWKERRRDMRTRYAGRPEDPEASPPMEDLPEPLRPDHSATPTSTVAEGAATAAPPSGVAGLASELRVELGSGQRLDLVLIPAGAFAMGDEAGVADEAPPHATRIEEPFYLARYEVSNAQYARFDAAHDSGYAHLYNKDHVGPGLPLNRPLQPVLRVSWERATAFCDWLSRQTGRRFSLPTEAQWEYACRAGTGTDLNYGDVNTDFRRYANLADRRLNELTIRDSPDWIPCVPGIDDGAAVTQRVGAYTANPWGLFDMHGNAAEWTRSAYCAYPFALPDGPDDHGIGSARVVRGGSYHDRPHRARSAFRLAYLPYQRVHNVGFRVQCEVDAAADGGVVQARRRRTP